MKVSPDRDMTFAADLNVAVNWNSLTWNSPPYWFFFQMSFLLTCCQVGLVMSFTAGQCKKHQSKTFQPRYITKMITTSHVPLLDIPVISVPKENDLLFPYDLLIQSSTGLAILGLNPTHGNFITYIISSAASFILRYVSIGLPKYSRNLLYISCFSIHLRAKKLVMFYFILCRS